MTVPATKPMSVQPTSHTMYPYRPLEKSPEVGSQYCAHDHDHESHACRKASRLRRVLLPALLSVLALCAVLFVACMSDAGDALGLGMGKRAENTSGSGNTLVDKKYYLIIVFVGLLLVVIFGVMLSAWCCRGSFENPLCCPCYLCACCGGLACLECVGCGLCAEGLDQA
ncbi:hypothetical protein PLICRDRAFT_45809 [Plicaturopsis crispa FD-325 SS-3]|uniref:Transmembrane protein n=1 Tax=Plicaturopsis crispa FD-325 SS-3 TaxID=944288 RepID=A0A0C9T6J0_PLICR|nr:hypothetical protein PLICRDRAFT_45809 [Plicaturopsis crispa FD-325 SS-3]